MVCAITKEMHGSVFGLEWMRGNNSVLTTKDVIDE
jgi:hypothetical protein